MNDVVVHFILRTVEGYKTLLKTPEIGQTSG